MITLVKLTLKNFAVVSATEINLDRGMSVITGETGTGKSLVVGAISLLLGERGRSEYIRAGSDHATIEGEFRGDLGILDTALAGEDVKMVGDTLVLVREIYADGRSRCLVNDQRVNLSTFKKIGERICDLHGQHQHQWLLDPARHLWFLDRFAGCRELYESYRERLSRYRELKGAIATVEEKIAAAKQKEELHRYQLEEINGIAPMAGEEELLETERRQLENIVRIKEVLQRAISNLRDDGAAIALTTDVLKQLSSIVSLLPAASTYVTELDSTRINLVEVARSLQEHEGRLVENPGRLEQIGERLAKIYQLKRKYGGSLESVLLHRDNIAATLAGTDNLESELAELRRRLEAAGSELVECSTRLQKARETGANKLSTAMRRELESLGMPKAQFTVEFRQPETDEIIEHEGVVYRLSDAGIMTGEFLFNANVGEELKPLAKVASGGEISRVMLALKSLIAGNDRVDLLVFDEIDSGIGGETALLVGRKLKELSRRQQLIVITHLQQIASFSDHHFKAVKSEKGKRTESQLLPLDQNERVIELGRMISGGEFGEEERKQVEKLLRKAGRKVSIDKP